jgi:hypothetical protein
MGRAGDQIEPHRDAPGLSETQGGAVPAALLFSGALMNCQTVRVVSPVSDENPHGYIVINESDLTEDHEVFAEEGEKQEAPATKRKYTKKTES